MPESNFEFVHQNLTRFILFTAKLFVVLAATSIVLIYKSNVFTWIIVAVITLIVVLGLFFLIDWLREGKEDDLVDNETIHNALKLFGVVLGVFGILYIPVTIMTLEAITTNAFGVGLMKWTVLGLPWIDILEN